MSFLYYYQFGTAGTAGPFGKAFVQGAPEAVLVTDGKLRDGSVALWGEHKWFKTLDRARAEGRTWYYGDHAYFGRGVYFRITKNALQVSGADFDKDPDANVERFAEVSAVMKAHKIHDEIKIYEKPQADPDGFIMLCPPSEALSERSGFTQAQWTARTVDTIKSVTNRRLVIRQKPKINRTPAPFLQAMQGAWCAVTYTGNIATEAMLGGYPCITTGPHPSNVFGNTSLLDIEKPYLPSPQTLRVWAGYLCRNQWTLAEIASGKAWSAVK